MSHSNDLLSIPTISTLYKQGNLHQAPSNSALYPASPAFNSRVSLIQADITKLATTCIVNAANTSLLGGSGVDGAIHAAAGPGLYEECLLLHGCPTGSAKITSAHDLPSKHVIHAVGPIYAKAKRDGGETKPKELLEGCYRTSLDLAAGLEDLEEKGGTSIAFSCLSTGAYGYPSNEAAGVASRCVRDWFEARGRKEGGEGGMKVDRVIFCCFLDKDVKAYEEWLPKVFPPTAAEHPSAQGAHGKPDGIRQEAEEEQGEEDDDDAVDDTNATTGNTQTLASTTLASEPAFKKQKQTPTTTAASSSSQQQQQHHHPPSTAAPTEDDDKEGWEAVERPHPSLASSTIDSNTSTAESEIERSAAMDESTVHVDAVPVAAAHGGGAGGLEDEEGVEVEKPGDLLEEEEEDEGEGVKVERPKVSSGMGPSKENLLGKDW